MSHARLHVSRRRLSVLLTVLLCLLGSEVALPVSTLAPGTATAAADSGASGDPASYDGSVGAGDCALLGRAFVDGLGCARDRCVEGAVVWRRTPGAEACALAGQPRGFGFAATVEMRTCRSLHRRWIPEVNYCVSQPDRSVPSVSDGLRCTPPATVYVTVAEVEGRYDECLTPRRFGELSDAAAARGTTLAHEVAVLQRQVAFSQGGVLVVGDSVTWRGGDELAGLEPGLTVDGQPARRPTELDSRLDAFRTRHGQPTGLVVELGTNPARGYDRDDLASDLDSLPVTTPVLLVLPYVEVGDSAAASPSSRRVGTWMRSVAAQRSHTCVADWPAYARAHPGLLQDGIHTLNAAEDDWARWLSGEWSSCLVSVDRSAPG